MRTGQIRQTGGVGILILGRPVPGLRPRVIARNIADERTEQPLAEPSPAATRPRERRERSFGMGPGPRASAGQDGSSERPAIILPGRRGSLRAIRPTTCSLVLR